MVSYKCAIILTIVTLIKCAMQSSPLCETPKSKHTKINTKNICSTIEEDCVNSGSTTIRLDYSGLSKINAVPETVQKMVKLERIIGRLRSNQKRRLEEMETEMAMYKKVPKIEPLDITKEGDEEMNELSSEETMRVDGSPAYLQLQEQAVSAESANLEEVSVHNVEQSSKKIAKENRSSISYSNDLPNSQNSRLDLLRKSINSYKNFENIWDLVKRLPTDQKHMCIDFRAIETHKKTFKPEELNRFHGYYEGFFNDLADYMEEHRPKARTKQQNKRDTDEDICKYTLGDLYMKQDLDVNAIKMCIKHSEQRGDCLFLKNRVEIILNIPEIYEDLRSMPPKVFNDTLKNTRTDKECLTSMQLACLEYLYNIFHCEKFECKEKEICICNMHLDALKTVKKSSGKTDSNYSIKELYKETYKAMALFYKHAPYYYESKKDGNIVEMMGKDVVAYQPYSMCEALIALKGESLGSGYGIVSNSLKYTPIPHSWSALTHKHVHYHIQFVDNSLHIIRRVCMPFLKDSTFTNPICVHTISDTIDYLEQIYNIEETRKIYALAIKENSSKWCILNDMQRNRYTINYFKKKNIYVVFYYVKEGLENYPFTLSVFKGPDSEQKDKERIPLFLSPFMQCIIEQLRLYTKEDGYEPSKKEGLARYSNVEPCVYTYVEPRSDTGVSEKRSSQAEQYYSNFYIDKNIHVTNVEICPSLSYIVKKIEETENQYKLTWYIRAPSKPQEYTHYSFNGNINGGNRKGQHLTKKLLTQLKRKNDCTDNPAYGFYTMIKVRHPWGIFFFQKKDKDIGGKYSSLYVPHCEFTITAFKTFNYTKSYLGIHKEILGVLLGKSVG